jgi:hypothetical protein
MRETATDRHVVELVYAYRLLSQEQLQRLIGKSRSRVQQILMRLYHHEYLERLFLPVWFDGRSPTLYILAKRGVQLLQGLGMTDFSGQPTPKLSSLFLEHTLAINDVRIAVAQATPATTWQLTDWLTEAALKSHYDRVTLQIGKQRPQKLSLIPDGYFRLEQPQQKLRTHFFLELDRGSMTQARFLTKVYAYLAYHQSGQYEKRYQAKGFRVLTVVDTPRQERVQHLLNATAQVRDIGRRFWFTHLSQLTDQNILTAPIWQVAGSPDAVALLTP